MHYSPPPLNKLKKQAQILPLQCILLQTSLQSQYDSIKSRDLFSSTAYSLPLTIVLQMHFFAQESVVHLFLWQAALVLTHKQSVRNAELGSCLQSASFLISRSLVKYSSGLVQPTKALSEQSEGTARQPFVYFFKMESAI